MWTRHGDSQNLSKEDSRQINKLLSNLLQDAKVMAECKKQTDSIISDLESLLIHGTKTQKQMAERLLPKYRRMKTALEAY